MHFSLLSSSVCLCDSLQGQISGVNYEYEYSRLYLYYSVDCGNRNASECRQIQACVSAAAYIATKRFYVQFLRLLFSPSLNAIDAQMHESRTTAAGAT